MLCTALICLVSEYSEFVHPPVVTTHVPHLIVTRARSSGACLLSPSRCSVLPTIYYSDIFLLSSRTFLCPRSNKNYPISTLFFSIDDSTFSLNFTNHF